MDTDSQTPQLDTSPNGNNVQEFGCPLDVAEKNTQIVRMDEENNTEHGADIEKSLPAESVAEGLRTQDMEQHTGGISSPGENDSEVGDVDIPGRATQLREEEEEEEAVLKQAEEEESKEEEEGSQGHQEQDVKMSNEDDGTPSSIYSTYAVHSQLVRTSPPLDRESGEPQSSEEEPPVVATRRTFPYALLLRIMLY